MHVRKKPWKPPDNEDSVTKKEYGKHKVHFIELAPILSCLLPLSKSS